MSRRSVFAACAALLAVPLASSAAPITAQNWRKHPAIAEIRAIYQQIRQAEAAGHLHKEHQAFGYCFAADLGRTLYLDAEGGVRSYHVDGGSDDSATQFAYYYDRDGALRFVFMQAGAVDGTVQEYRVYLSKAGKRLWEERRDLKGPGHPGFPDTLSDEQLIKDPKRAFYARDPCAEEK